MPWRDNKRVSLKIDKQGVGQVRLTRADKLNAIDPQMCSKLEELGTSLAEEKRLRAVVLAGEGKAFSAGIDIYSILDEMPIIGQNLTARTHGNANIFQQICMQWRKLPVPVIAAIHGFCYGAGLQIASGADIRIVTPDARLGILETKWGIVPDMGGYALWKGNVRDDILRELIYTQREFSGAEAVEMGFATHLADDPIAKATELAEEIASCSPHAIQAAKRLSNHIQNYDTDHLLMQESQEQQALLSTDNHREAMKAYAEKRPPKFRDV